MKVFISGTTHDFGVLRRELADLFRRFEQIQITPVVQDSLAEETDQISNVVSMLIGNVRKCDLTLGLIGNEGGFPKTPDERRRVSQFAAEWLTREFQQSRLHPLWEEWNQINAGMTYTQLEIFLSLSAANWKGTPMRTRLYLPRGLDEAAAEGNQQNRYIDFLLRHQVDLDWRSHDDLKINALTLAVEYELSRRDEFQTLTAAVPAREALRQRLASLRRVAEQGNLLDRSYDRFYWEVWSRMGQSIPVLKECSVPQLLAKERLPGRPAIVSSDSQWLTVTIRLKSDLSTLTYDREGLTIRNQRLRPIGEQEYPLSVSADGEAVLTHAPDGRRLYIGNKPPKHVTFPELNTFSLYPALVEQNDCYWAVTVQADKSYEAISLGNHTAAFDATKLPKLPQILFFSAGEFEVAVGCSIPLAHNSLLLEGGDAFVLHPPAGSHGVESLQRLRFAPMRVMDLFQVNTFRSEVGDAAQNTLEFDDRKLLWVVETNDGSMRQRLATVLCDQWPASDIPCLSSREVSPSDAPTLRLPQRADSPAVQVPFPYSLSFEWTTSSEFLLGVVSEQKSGRGYTAYAWRFPRPLDEGKFVAHLWNILAGAEPVELCKSGNAALRAMPLR